MYSSIVQCPELKVYDVSDNDCRVAEVSHMSDKDYHQWYNCQQWRIANGGKNLVSS